MATNIPNDRRGDAFYGLNRDKTETERLNEQHRIFTQSIKFLIHPSISFRKPNLRIADFATGTGIWLRDVSKVVEDTCTLDGFDISPAQFPHPSELPPNVSLSTHDILKPLPTKYHGSYDIIAVRALVTVLMADEWAGAVSNLVTCLKPNGWLQWIDVDASPHSFKAVVAEPMAPTRALQQSVSIFNKWATVSGRPLDASNRLPELFRAAGLEQIRHEKMSTDNDPSTRKDFSIEISIGLESLFERCALMKNTDLTVDEAMDIAVSMRREAEEGKAYLRMDFNIVTGRRPDTYIVEN